MSIKVIVLAAGQGTRMRTGLAKVLHEAAGRSLLEWALHEIDGLDVDETVVVVGHQADEVIARTPDTVTTVVQEPQKGTGHAASVGLHGLTSHDGTVLVLPGDMPLIRGASLRSVLAEHEASGAIATIMAVDRDDPTGYGRIVRRDGAIVGIVEERDATPDQREIREVNTSVYAFDGGELAAALSRIENHNAQGEYYLTDAIEVLVAEGKRVTSVTVDTEEGTGVNTQLELSRVARVLRARINASLLESGVWMLDPDRVYVDATANVEPGSRLHPETYLRGATNVAAGAEIGPNVVLTDTEVGRDAVVTEAVAISARIGDGASVGPATDPRCRISATSATPRSARDPTSGRGRSPSTTTAPTNTERRSAIGSTSEPTRCSSHP
jgi:bifunctional UDP-N-acetylglucosamine pyrophosphorylase/glucosamine-1-phosphate N-acetyltransferase